MLPKTPATGYKLFALAMAFLASSDAIGNVLVKEGFTPTLLIIIRSGFLTIFSLFLVLFSISFKEFFVMKHMKIILIRGIFQGLASVFYFSAFKYIPFSMAASLFFCAPIALLAFSPFLLKEKVSTRQWFTVLLGFIGVLLIINPFSLDFSNLLDNSSLIGCVFGLTAMFFSMLFQIFTKKLAGKVVTYSLVFWGNFISAIIGTVFFLFQSSGYTAVQFSDILSLIIVAILAFLGQIFFIIPYNYVRASDLAPFNYFQLAITVVIGMTFFAERPPLLAFIGMLLIFTAGTLQGYFTKKGY